MKDKYGVIYLIRNKVNNKVYIGQTTGNFNSRYKGNLYKNTHNPHIKNAIDKYGLDKFYIDEAFDVAYSKEELDKLEDMYIKLWRSCDSRYGYNKMFGGSCGLHTEETKYAMRLKQRELSGVKVVCVTIGEVFDSIADATRKYNVCSSEIISCCKKKIAKAGYINKTPLQWLYYKEYIKGEKPLILKDTRVICTTTNEVFSNMQECVKKYTNTLISGISQCCNGEYNSHGSMNDGTKMQWLYYREYLKGVRPKEISDGRIICTTTNKIFNSVAEIQKYYCIDVTHIHKACRKEALYSGTLEDGTKLQWLYYRDYLNSVNVERIKDTRVICLNNKEVFACIKDAVQKYSLDKSSIAKCCNHKRKSCGKDVDGTPLKWMKYEEYQNKDTKDEVV